MVKIYGIPNAISSNEVFMFNQGRSSLRILFQNGCLDPKMEIPATYSTDNEFEQIVIETSPQFGQRIFRYNADGRIITDSSLTLEIKNAIAEAESGTTKKKVEKKSSANIVDEGVRSLGDATEVLLSMGASAAELNGVDGVLSTMQRMHVTFPNLVIK